MEPKMLKSFDDTKLFVKAEVPRGAKAIVLIVHGLCEHQGRYDLLSHRLLEKGFGVCRFDHRGHGRSEGPRIYFDDYTQIFKDIHGVAEWITKGNPDVPLYLIGHSMGGYGIALFGSHFPGMAKGFIFSGALTRNRGNTGAQLNQGMDPKEYFANELGAGICSDFRVVEAYEKDPLVEKQISAGLFQSIFQGVAWLKDNPHRFRDPALVLHGARDGLVSFQDSLDFFKEIESEDKTLKIYSKLQHEIFNEYSKDEVIGDVLFWLEKQLNPAHVHISYTDFGDNMMEDLGL